MTVLARVGVQLATASALHTGFQRGVGLMRIMRNRVGDPQMGNAAVSLRSPVGNYRSSGWKGSLCGHNCLYACDAEGGYTWIRPSNPLSGGTNFR